MKFTYILLLPPLYLYIIEKTECFCSRVPGKTDIKQVKTSYMYFGLYYNTGTSI